MRLNWIWGGFGLGGVLVWVLLKTSVLGHLDKKKAPISRGLAVGVGYAVL